MGRALSLNFYSGPPLKMLTTQVVSSSQALPGWPGVVVDEVKDTSGSVHRATATSHRVAVLLGGGCETWWRAGGFGRWRRAEPGALSVAAAGPVLDASWIGARHMAFVSITPRFVREIADEPTARAIEAMGAIYCVHEFYDDAPTGRQLVLRLLELARLGTPETAMPAEQAAIELVDWLGRLARLGARLPIVPADGLSPAQLRRVTELIDGRLAEPITLAELAKVAGVSPFHFARQFKRAAGVSPWQYVMHLRVERAAALLDRTRTPPGAVAVACGFADQSHLSRVFKRFRGVTPGSYRHRNER